MSSLKFLSNCRYIASPFANVQDLSWRLLVRKLGVHLCFTSVEKTVYNPIQDATNTRDDFSGLLTTKQDDRPLIVQVRDLLLASRSTVAPLTAAWLAQLVEHQTAVREVEGSSPRPDQLSGS